MRRLRIPGDGTVHSRLSRRRARVHFTLGAPLGYGLDAGRYLLQPLKEPGELLPAAGTEHHTSHCVHGVKLGDGFWRHEVVRGM